MPVLRSAVLSTIATNYIVRTCASCPRPLPRPCVPHFTGFSDRFEPVLGHFRTGWKPKYCASLGRAFHVAVGLKPSQNKLHPSWDPLNPCQPHYNWKSAREERSLEHTGSSIENEGTYNRRAAWDRRTMSLSTRIIYNLQPHRHLAIRFWSMTFVSQCIMSCNTQMCDLAEQHRYQPESGALWRTILTNRIWSLLISFFG